MKQKKTQQDMILKHLKTRKKGITSKEAIEKYGCTRLSAVINALRKKGHKISVWRENVPTRYGNTSIAHYVLEA